MVYIESNNDNVFITFHSHSYTVTFLCITTVHVFVIIKGSKKQPQFMIGQLSSNKLLEMLSKLFNRILKMFDFLLHD